MWPNAHETAHFVTFTDAIFDGKLRFLCSVNDLSVKNKFLTLERGKHVTIWRQISRDTRFRRHSSILIYPLCGFNKVK